MTIFKRFFLIMTLFNLIKFCFGVKLINATELNDCASVSNPTSSSDCLNRNYTEIVCCFYQMTFPVVTNVCNGASISSRGITSESALITLATDIRVQGSLDCSSSYIERIGFFLFTLIYFLF
jgi:hypothetical protein